MTERVYRNLADPQRAMARLRELVEDAEELVVVSAPTPLVDELAPELERALDRGVLVLLLVGGDATIETARDRTYPATLVRYWESVADFVVSALVDYDRGLVSMAELHDPEGAAGRALVYRDGFIGDMQFNTIVIARWQQSPEIYARESPALPRAYESLFEAVIDGARHLREGRPLAARVAGHATTTDEQIEIEGPVVNVRQNLVSPSTNTFPIEQSLVVDTGERVYTVGGPSAQIEDLRADRVELYEE